MSHLKLSDFPLRTFDKIRYADTDRQGHVNNAQFSTFIETGRVEALYNTEFGILKNGFSFVIASLNLDFQAELRWPGTVEIGTGVTRIGTSSITLKQYLYQNDLCVATAETVIVHVDNETTKGSPLSNSAKEQLEKWIL
ncbi:MAG: acyl-CoA thioesterase [Bdellovibrionales bacterium]|nr:acyl-CoA thioesterase [Bdellovibrionales bacterium]